MNGYIVLVLVLSCLSVFFCVYSIAVFFMNRSLSADNAWMRARREEDAKREDQLKADLEGTQTELDLLAVRNVQLKAESRQIADMCFELTQENTLLNAQLKLVMAQNAILEMGDSEKGEVH